MLRKLMAGFLALLVTAVGAFGQASEPALDRLETGQPKDVYEIYSDAMKQGDWPTACRKMTPRMRDDYVWNGLFVLWQWDKKDLLERHVDKEQLRTIPKDDGFLLSRQEIQARAVAAVKDKPAFLSAFFETFKKQIIQDVPGDLRDVKIMGTRARGIATAYVTSVSTDTGVEKDPYDHPLYFRRTESGWLVDEPTREEASPDAQAALAEFETETPLEEETVHDLLDGFF